MSIKNRAKSLSIIIVVVLFVGVSYYYFSKVRPYNQFLSNANQAMTTENYDKAVTLYEEAMTYKSDSNVNKKINIAKLLKKSKETYAIAVKHMEDKDYLTAINTFIKVDKQDTKRYSDSQNSISNCKKLYISNNLKNANDNITNTKFDEANKYLDNIITIDSNNTDVKKLKAHIVTALQKQKDDATKLKNDIAKAAQKKKDDAEALAKVNASKQAQKLTSQQALALVKSKVKLGVGQYLTTPVLDNYNGAECYVIDEYYLNPNPSYPNEGNDICIYYVNINTKAITQCTQGTYTSIN